MNRSKPARGQTLPVVAILIAIVAVTAIVAGSRLAAGNAVPSAAPTERPSPVPTLKPAPTPSETPVPSDGPVKVDLDIATDHDVSVVIDDRTGAVVDARSGHAGDGMSVRWFDVKAENVDADTIRVTWAGLPRDEVIATSISSQDGKIWIRMVQASPPKNSDAIGFDRVLDLTFDKDVSADDVQVSIEDAVD